MKPEVILDYNKYMLGVDKIDQLVSYYSFIHKSVKWWRKVFFWLLEVAVVNSYVIYKEECNKDKSQPLTHLSYRRKLIDDLSKPLCDVPRLSGTRSQSRVEQSQHFLRKVTKRTDCVVCSERSGGQRHLTLFRCATCSDIRTTTLPDRLFPYLPHKR